MTENAAVQASTEARPRRQSTVARRVRRGAIGVLWALAGLALTILMWELAKWLGGIISLPFKTSDSAMPHVWTMWAGALAARGPGLRHHGAAGRRLRVPVLAAHRHGRLRHRRQHRPAARRDHAAVRLHGARTAALRHRVADRPPDRAGAADHGHRQPDQHRARPVEHDVLGHVHRVVPRVLPDERRRPARPARADAHRRSSSCGRTRPRPGPPWSSSASPRPSPTWCPP